MSYKFMISLSILSCLFVPIGMNIEMLDASPAPTAQSSELVKNDAANALSIENFSVADRKCLSETVHGEASGETKLAKLAMAIVIRNRVDSRRHPNTICEVVKEPKQFSMWNEGDPNLKRVQDDFNSYEVGEVPSNDILESIHVSMQSLLLTQTQRDLIVPKSGLNYHTTAVNPIWSKGLKKYETIGITKFYTNT